MKEHGFTLIEVLIVASITVTIASFLIASFSRTQVDLNRIASGIVAEIRSSQAQAVFSSSFQGKPRCGYGIRPLNTTQYSLFTGPSPRDIGVVCSSQDRLYEAGIDTTVRDVTLPDTNVEFKLQGAVYFSEVFFEPPDPKTYVNGDAALGIPPSQMLLGPLGVNCSASPGDCKVICIYTSGEVEAETGATCSP